jgi:hypothetical protein
MPPQTLSAAQKRHLDAFMRFGLVHKLRRFVLQFLAMLRWRSARKLINWIDSVRAFGFRLRLSCDDAAPRFRGSGAIDDNAMGQWAA